MALEQPLLNVSRLTAADLSAKQFHAVKETSSGLNVAGAGEQAIGILQDDPASGKVGNVMCAGVSKAYFGDTVTKGQTLMANAAGKLVPHTGTNAAVAIALEGGSANELRSVLLIPGPGAGISAGYSVVAFPIELDNVADGDVVTGFVPGFAGLIVSTQFVVTDAVTTASKATTLNLEIGTTNVTGGVVALTSANCTPLGARVAGSSVTANNAFSASDAISVEASSTTAFAEGKGTLYVTLKST